MKLIFLITGIIVWMIILFFTIFMIYLFLIEKYFQFYIKFKHKKRK